MTKENAISEARKIWKQQRIPMVVVHAPIEMIEDAGGDLNQVYGYCPLAGVDILYNFALKGLGQKDCPAQGIVKRFGC